MSNGYVESILDNDQYKFSMQNAVCKLYPRAEVKYTFINRDNREFPDHFGEELRRIIDTFRGLILSKEQKEFIKNKCYYFDPVYCDFLSGYRYDPTEVIIKQEGPKLTCEVVGLWYRVILWEVQLMAVISQLYFEMTGLTKLTRQERRQINREKAEVFNKIGAHYADFGTRRRYSYKNHKEVVQDFVKYGNSTFIGSSNVKFAMENNITPIGTLAHEWVSAISSLRGVRYVNEHALEDWVKVYEGDLGIALPDTFGTTSFLNDFNSKYAKLFDGVRQDSGNPLIFARRIIDHYKMLKIDPLSKTIIFSDGLNYNKICAIHAFCKNKINAAYGIGTNLSNDVGLKPLNIVIKLTEVNDTPVVKLSDDFKKAVGNVNEIKYVKRMMVDMQYYVYIILDPRKQGKYDFNFLSFPFKPFYIGKGKGKRAENHLNVHLKTNKKNSPKNNKIKKIVSSGYEPVIVKIAQNLSEKEAYNLEKYLIRSIGRKVVNIKYPLMNLTEGGEGEAGRVVSEETKRKISRTLKGKFKGRKLSDEWKNKISENNARYWLGKKNPISETTKKKLSDSLKGRTKTRYKLTSPKGEEFIVDGLKDICLRYKLQHSHLISVAKGKRKSHKNWICEYLTKPQR